ncbi:MAG: ATP-dependent DNA ligase [Candidatus Aenigmarchaeota archaeon]|nr:ATP-dependent DNA ligase [Candidatus Aenigmarchaeota archaeon]
MEYKKLVEIYNKLGSTTKKLEKADILADFFKHAEADLDVVVMLSLGRVFPKGEKELGIADKLIIEILKKTCGATQDEIIKLFKKTGDLGTTAEMLVKNKKQATLFKRELTIKKIFENLKKLPDISGAGSQEKKIDIVSELISSASPEEAKYIVRTILEQMRFGVSDGIVRDAIARAFGKTPGEIERQYNFTGNFGSVAKLAKENKLYAELEIGKPIRCMLADRAGNLKEAMEKFNNPAIEIKMDGFRTQVHKYGNNVKIFSRRMDEVTSQFPDVVGLIRKYIKADSVILDAETIAVNPVTKAPLAFQVLSRRIQRKYDIDKIVREIPVQVNVFDLLALNNKSYMDESLLKRWEKLKSIVTVKTNIRLVEHMETKDYGKAEKFYKKSLSMGEEGVIVKNLDAYYQPGRRVGYWLKVKDMLEPLDLVVIGGEWGEGKRAKYVGTILLGARRGTEFVATGMLGSGLLEKETEGSEKVTLQKLTNELKKDIIEEKGNEIKVRPRIVLEIGYEEIQKSSKYPSGYALRFPRLLRIRTREKNPEDADTVATIEKIYEQQIRKQKN